MRSEYICGDTRTLWPLTAFSCESSLPGRNLLKRLSTASNTARTRFALHPSVQSVVSTSTSVFMARKVALPIMVWALNGEEAGLAFIVHSCIDVRAPNVSRFRSDISNGGLTGGPRRGSYM